MVESFAAFKSKDDPLIGADGNGEKPSQFSFQGVQMKSRDIHGLNCWRSVQSGENQPDPRYHIRRQLAAVVMLKQSLQAFVPKAPNH
jgi:hypothetical protein